MAVSIVAQHNRAQRPDQERHTETAERKQYRHGRIAGREKRMGDIAGKEAVNRNIKPLQRITDAGGKQGFVQAGFIRVQRCGGIKCAHAAPPAW